MIVAVSFQVSVSITASAASLATSIRPSIIMLLDVSITSTTCLGPDAADEYHGRKRGS